MAGTTGDWNVSPSAKTAMLEVSSTAAVTEPGTSPAKPMSVHDAAHTRLMSISTRVRRWPSIRWMTTSCSSTIVAVLTAKATPMSLVEASATVRA